MTSDGCLSRTTNKSSLGHAKEGNEPPRKASNAPSFAYWLRSCHLDGRADARPDHGSAGIFLVGREHKMPELKKKKNHVILMTSFHLFLQPIRMWSVIHI